MMSLRISAGLAAAAAMLLISGPAFALTTLTGDDAIMGYFDPNNTHPSLELQVVGSTLETTGGVSLSTSGSFDLDIKFLADGEANGHPNVFDNLILTAALDSGADNSGVSVTVVFGGDSAVLSYAGDFTDAATFGLPFPGNPPPPKGIKGIANGAGDFLSLNGALVGAFDLMLVEDFERGDVVTISLNVTGIDADSIVRFDIFGTDENGNIIGNNPNSGAAGVVPEPSAALAFSAGLLVVGSTIRRRKS